MRELNARSTAAILALPELEVLIHQCNDVTLAVDCPLALLRQYRSISNQTEDQTCVMRRVVTKQYDAARIDQTICTRGWYIRLIFVRWFNKQSGL